MILFFLLFSVCFSNIKIKEGTLNPTLYPTPSRSPLETPLETPRESETPYPTQSPTKSFEIIVMNPLKSNTTSPTLSVIAVVSLAIFCTASIVYIIFYILPFLREDFSPLL